MKVKATQDGHYDGYYRTEGEIFEVDEKPYQVKGPDGSPLFETDESGKKKLDKQGKPIPKMATWFAASWMEPVAEETEVTNDYPPFQIPSVYREKKTKPSAVPAPRQSAPVI